MGERYLDVLLGEQLSAVSFVMDYVEFHFDGAVLRALSEPIIETPGGRWRFPEPGSRDALCTPIGRRVEVAVFETDERIEVGFEGKARLIIPLDPDSFDGPEAAHFMTSGQFVFIV